MALYGSARDASLIRSINKELINKQVDTEVAYYKLKLESSGVNIYNESDVKVYYAPQRVNCLVALDDKVRVSDDYGIDLTRTAQFAFLRDTLVERNLVSEVGDIIQYDSDYFEIDNIRDGQYWSGRNPSKDIGYTEGLRGEFGYSVSIICETHLTRRSTLNIEKVHSGINSINNIPRNI
jgi:hypothetical protein